MYYPVQGMLRGTLISNEHRATVRSFLSLYAHIDDIRLFLQLSSLFRVPLNVFVVVSLLTGVSSARYAVLTASSIMLVFSSLMTGAVIVSRSDEQQQQANGAIANGNGHR